MANVSGVRRERPSLQQEFDVRNILQQAQVRWLKPPEICEILQNYNAHSFQLNAAAPDRPPSGSLFLFDRKAVRHYRKDGHSWRKKNDGKTVREAHERLKVDSVEVLHCYYAHGDDNAKFQRRSYWMLEGEYENIVLVHYLETKQGVKSKLSHLANSNMADKVVPSGNHEVSLVDSSLSSELADVSTSCNLKDIDGADCREKIDNLQFTMIRSTLQDLSQSEIMPEGTIDLPSWDEFIHSQDFSNQDADSSIWEELYKICNDIGVDAHDDAGEAISQSSFPMKTTVEAPFFSKGPDYLIRNGSSQQPPETSGSSFRILDENAFQAEALINDLKVENCNVAIAHAYDVGITSTEENKTSQQVGTSKDISSSNLSRFLDQIQHIKQDQAVAVYSPYDAGNWNNMVNSSAVQSQLQKGQNQIKQELQLVGRDYVLQPMSLHLTQEDINAEISVPKPNSASLIPREHGVNNKTKADAAADSYCLKHLHKPQQFLENTPGLHSDVQMDIELNHPLNQATKFSILDFSPNWGISYEETKVLISGIFLRTENPQQCQWSCVFDDIEVPAEVSNVGVISCKAPSHSPGRVPFFVSCGAKSACSEVRQFEYRTERLGCSSQGETTSPKEEDLFWKMQLARMLLSGCEDEMNDWDDMEQLASITSSIDLKEKIFQIVMKEKLEDWLLAKVNEGANAVSILNSHGQGLLHLVAVLGYEWAILPILAAGVGVNFRDARGWSALHWAAAHGREKVVLALLEAGAVAGPLTDPTPEFINGQTPADLAASRGHHGLAGFLAEISLTTHFKSLTIIENNDKEFFSVSADWEGENAAEALADNIRRKKSVDGVDDQLSFEQSLRAVRNAAQTAALIRAAFRQHSFRKREESEMGVFDEFGISPSQLKKIQYAQKLQKTFQARWKKRHTAAMHIQSKFRGWRKRKDFLDLRHRVIKIQAHVRGYQVRKKYTKLIWAVGILEKSILRWRRKRIGLRDIHVRNLDAMEEDTGAIDDDDAFFEEGRRQKELIVDKAVKRVQCMVGSTEARAQYSRLLESSQQHNLAYQMP